MQKVSLKKLTVLGAVLFAASAVASAFMPASTKSLEDCNGVAVNSTLGGEGAGDRTCAPAVDDQTCYTVTDPSNVSSSGTSAGITATAATQSIVCVQ